MHNQPMQDSEGQFSQWRKCRATNCRKCNSSDVEYREWNSSDGAYTDYQYCCQKCGHMWWVDGIDS